jgi:hypothetical protein
MINRNPRVDVITVKFSKFLFIVGNNTGLTFFKLKIWTIISFQIIFYPIILRYQATIFAKLS